MGTPAIKLMGCIRSITENSSYRLVLIMRCDVTGCNKIRVE